MNTDQILLDFLYNNRVNKPRILVVGDQMIDQYFDVQMNRISPEIPTTIMSSPNEDYVAMPGGAANVAYQLKNFNVDTVLAGITSNKDNVFFERCNAFKTCSVVGDEVRIPIKKRFVFNGFQVKRWDVEDKQYGLSDETYGLYSNLFMSALSTSKSSFKPDVVIFSDYDKGLFKDTPAIVNMFKDTLTIVDPKKGPLNKWQGCKVIKPNEKEAQELTGKTDWQEQCDEIIKTTGCETVIITRGDKGFVGKHLDGFFYYTTTDKVVVESVVGAGDCFMAMLAIALSQGCHPYAAAYVAYKAGSIYVQNRLNRPIVPGELSPTKIVNPEDLAKRDFRLVFTNGCFDLLHAGHLSSLRFAKGRGDKLVVAINDDESVRRLKGDNRPIIGLEQRMELMANLECVDFVCSFSEDTPIHVIQKCNPDLICKGADYEGQKVIGADIAPIVYAPLVSGLSTTNIVHKIKTELF